MPSYTGHGGLNSTPLQVKSNLLGQHANLMGEEWEEFDLYNILHT